jgi:hypothetical protein
MDNLFSTHPSTENRVAALDRLSREMRLGGLGAARTTTSRAPLGAAAPDLAKIMGAFIFTLKHENVGR